MDSSTDSNNSNSYCKFDDDFRHYLQNFNAIVVSKIKSTIEKRIQEEYQFSSKINETNTYLEISRHFHYFLQLSETNLFNFDDYSERAKCLIQLGIKYNHYPLFVYGSPNTGKSVTLAKFGMLAHKIIESKNCMVVVRFYNLTSQCSSFEGLLYSICEQLCSFQKLNSINELKNKDVSELIDYFYQIIQLISKNNKKQLLILIDGLQDINVEKSLLSKSNASNNQISWLFMQNLPPRVHMIVSIKKHANTIRNDNEIVLKGQKIPNLNSTQMNNSVPLFLSCFNEKASSEAENYFFELPINIKKSDLNELGNFIKSELIKNQRVLSDQQLQTVLQAVSNLIGTSSSSSSSSIEGSFQLSSTNTSETQSYFAYLNFILKDIINKNVCFNSIFNENHFPNDTEAFVKYKLGKFLKKSFPNNFLILGDLFVD